MADFWPDKGVIPVVNSAIRGGNGSTLSFSREQALEKKDRSETTSHEQQSSQHCWQCQAHATYPAERYSNPKTLTTIYPYGDPAVLTYDNVSLLMLLFTSHANP